MLIKPKLKSIIDKQFGYFTSQQALASGYSKDLYRYHVKCGNWITIFRGIYRLKGFADSYESELVKWSLWASKVYKQQTVIVGYNSALYYYRLSEIKPNQCHLIVPHPRNMKEGESCHFHIDDIEQSQIIQKEGFYISTPYRTLCDMKPDLILKRKWVETVHLAQSKNLIDEAMVSDLFSGRQNYAAVITDARDKQGDIMAASPILSVPNRNISQNRSFPQYPTGRQIKKSAVWGNRSAFTLVELLVVIAIISILAAMLLPALVRVRNSAVKISCMNMMKQLYLGYVQYDTDFGSQPQEPGFSSGSNAGYSIKFGNEWRGLGMLYSNDYVKEGKLFYCPSADNMLSSGMHSYKGEAGTGNRGWRDLSTTYNNYWLRWCSATHNGIEIGSASVGSHIATMNARLSANSPNRWLLVDYWGYWHSQDEFWLPHPYSINLLSVDGSVRSFPMTIEQLLLKYGGCPSYIANICLGTWGNTKP